MSYLDMYDVRVHTGRTEAVKFARDCGALIFESQLTNDRTVALFMPTCEDATLLVASEGWLSEPVLFSLQMVSPRLDERRYQWVNMYEVAP